MRDVLRENYYNFDSMQIEDKYLVQTRSQAKASEVKLLEVHGVEKVLDLHVKPEGQKSVNPPTEKRIPSPKCRAGQGRVRIRRKVRITINECRLLILLNFQ